MIYYLDDMEDLEDILDEIRGHDTSSEDDESIVEFFPDEEAETDFVESCIALMYDFVDENPQAISEPDFEEQLLENVRELFLIPFHHFFFLREFPWHHGPWKSRLPSPQSLYMCRLVQKVP